MEGQPFSPKQLLDNAVANIICSLLFGNRYQYGDKELVEIQHSTDKIFEFLGTSNVVCNFPMIDSRFYVYFLMDRFHLLSALNSMRGHVSYLNNCKK